MLDFEMFNIFSDSLALWNSLVIHNECTGTSRQAGKPSNHLFYSPACAEALSLSKHLIYSLLMKKQRKSKKYNNYVFFLPHQLGLRLPLSLRSLLIYNIVHFLSSVLWFCIFHCHFHPVNFSFQPTLYSLVIYLTHCASSFLLARSCHISIFYIYIHIYIFVHSRTFCTD